MARFRIETVVDRASGRIAAELYYPDDQGTPTATTRPIYPTHEIAAAEVVKIFQKAFPEQPIFVSPEPDLGEEMQQELARQEAADDYEARDDREVFLKDTRCPDCHQNKVYRTHNPTTGRDEMVCRECGWLAG